MNSANVIVICVRIVKEPIVRPRIQPCVSIGIGIGGLKSDGLAAPVVGTEKSYPA